MRPDAPDTIRLSDIVFDEALYPRSAHDPGTVNRYADSPHELPALVVDQHDRLLDGRHRMLAMQKAGIEEAPAQRVEVDDDAGAFLHATEINAMHGLPLTHEETKAAARKIYAQRRGHSMFVSDGQYKAIIASALCVSKRTVQRWTEAQDKVARTARKAEVDADAAAGVSQRETAKRLGVARSTVQRDAATEASEGSEAKAAEREETAADIALGYTPHDRDPDWDDPVFSHWPPHGVIKSGQRPDHVEEWLLDRLLWCYTRPGDIVVAPFAGADGLMGICGMRGRRSFTPALGAGADTPPDLPEGMAWEDVGLVFLNPPEALCAAPEALSLLMRRYALTLPHGAVVALLMASVGETEEGRPVHRHFEVARRLTDRDAMLDFDHELTCPHSGHLFSDDKRKAVAKTERRPIPVGRSVVAWRVNAR